MLAVLGFSASPTPAAAQQVDVIRGRITGTENEPLDNVAVVVTSISGNVNRTARTDRAGRFTVTFPGGDGDYLVTVTALVLTLGTTALTAEGPVSNCTLTAGGVTSTTLVSQAMGPDDDDDTTTPPATAEVACGA